MKMAAICLSVALAMSFGDDGAAAAAAADGVVAIDVLLLPDAAMTERVRELNRVLQYSGAGFAFDATHVPHLTLLQCFVRRRICLPSKRQWVGYFAVCRRPAWN